VELAPPSSTASQRTFNARKSGCVCNIIAISHISGGERERVPGRVMARRRQKTENLDVSEQSLGNKHADGPTGCECRRKLTIFRRPGLLPCSPKAF